MRWNRRDDGWRWRFAIIPVCISDGPEQQWVWLEWYEARFAGEFYEIRLPQ
jgi:hypothetical protein